MNFKANVLLNPFFYVLKNLRKCFSAIYRQNHNLHFQPSIAPQIRSQEQQTDEIHILANEVSEKLKCSSERQAKPQGKNILF